MPAIFLYVSQCITYIKEDLHFTKNFEIVSVFMGKINLLCILSTLLALTDNPLQKFSRALLPFSDFWSLTSHKLNILFFSFIYKRQSPQNHSLVTFQTCKISSDKELVIFSSPSLKETRATRGRDSPDTPDKPLPYWSSSNDVWYSYILSELQEKYVLKTTNKQTKLIIICIQ